MKRFAQPEEIADAIVFLLSKRSSYITGTGLRRWRLSHRQILGVIMAAILITGVSTGIGNALARYHLARGDEVLAVSRNPAPLSRHRSTSTLCGAI